MNKYKINDIITINNHFHGTIRYIGNIKDREGIWVGIELTEPLGKNDGTYKNVRYFHADENHGIFVKLEKLKEPSIKENLDSSAFLESHILNKTKEKYKERYKNEVLKKEAQKGFYLKMIRDLKDKANSLEERSQFLNRKNKESVMKSIDFLITEVDNISETLNQILKRNSLLLWDEDSLRVRELMKIMVNKIFDNLDYQKELNEFRELLGKEGIELNM